MKKKEQSLDEEVVKGKDDLQVNTADEKAVIEESSEKEERPTKIKVKKQDVHKKGKKSLKNLWAVKILVLTICLSLSFSIVSELTITKTGLIVSILILIPLLATAVITDMLGVAVASCHIEPFRAMASRKVRGAKESIYLIKNAEKVSSICNDVIGDVCGIISGAIGVSIVAKILTEQSTNAQSILIASLVSALIAGLTVFGKALGKKYALKNSTKIVGLFGKFCSLFTSGYKNNKKN